MTASLRPLSLLGLASLLAACAGQPHSELGELPPQTASSIDQLLLQAEQSSTSQALLLRLSAAERALQDGDLPKAAQLLDSLAQQPLPPAQQIFLSTLQAELALQRQRPRAALKALQHPDLARLDELPLPQQIRTRHVLATALERDHQLLAAARERIALGALLDAKATPDNQEAIWELLSGLSSQQLKAIPADRSILAGWRDLLELTRSPLAPREQINLIETWQTANTQHPAAIQPPLAIVQLREIARRPLSHIALLLPAEGPLASAGNALRDGFLAAHYQAGAPAGLKISLHDSNALQNLDAFYQSARESGVELVVGPLEKPLVSQLAQRTSLPLPTLALNYSDNPAQAPRELFQFGLSAEDEAREAARRAWADGHRRAVALAPSGDWGQRVMAAFRSQWEAQGGSLIAVDYVDQPVRLAGQIAQLLQLRDSEQRAARVAGALGTRVQAQPARRQDIDFVFLAATPAQARQIKATLTLQYAGDLPVYGTSHLFDGNNQPARDRELDGIRFSEIPWMLETNHPLRRDILAQWPQASSTLGRLYAMGADSYHLAQRLSQLQTAPGMRLEGLSGSLSLGSAQRIDRTLPWAEYRNGQLVRLPPTRQ